MSYQDVLMFNAAVDQAQKNQQNAANIQSAQDNHDTKTQLLKIDKQKAALDLQAQSMTNADTQLNLDAKKQYMDQLFGTQQKVLDGQKAQLDIAETQQSQQAKQAAQIAQFLHQNSPDVQAFVNGQVQGNTATPKPQPATGGTPAMTVPNGQGSAVIGGDNGSPSNAVVPSLFGNLTPQQQSPVSGPGSQSTAPSPPMSMAPDSMIKPVGSSTIQPASGTAQPAPSAQVTQAGQAGQAGQAVPQSQAAPVTGSDPSLPPLEQVYSGLSKAPFGQATSDLYMKNPNFMEAIKSGNYLIKKDPTQVESENPLALNENDRTILTDAPKLSAIGYSKPDIFKQLTPGTQSLIDTVGQYRATPAELTSSLGGGRQKQELVKAVQTFYPKWSDAVYDQRHQALKDFTDPNGVNGQTVASIRQGVYHLDELTNSIDAVSNKTMQLGNRQIPILNAPMNAIMQYVGGDPDILALKQNINAVTEEMTKAWGGAKAGEARLANWRGTMNATNSPQGWSGLLSKTATLWQEASKARESMFSLAMGGQKMQDVLGEGILLPDQNDILNRIKGGYTPGQNSSGVQAPAGRVAIQGPDGKQYSVPQEQLGQAIKEGYRKL